MANRDELRSKQARGVSRVCGAYMLRSIMGLAAQLDYDYSLAVVYLAIQQASLGALNDDPELAARWAASDAIIPNDQRRPISVHALAVSLHMPYETTRRSVGRLTEMGFVNRVSRSGVIASAEGDARAANLASVDQNHIDAMRMIGLLKRHGVDLDAV